MSSIVLSLTRSAMRSISRSLIHLIRNLGDDDRLLVFGDVLDGGACAHHEAAAAGAVGFEDSGAAVNDAAGREVGALHEFQNFRQLRVRDYSPA